MINIFKKKRVQPILTPVMMIEKANCIVDSAMNMFKKSIQEIESANKILEESRLKTTEKMQSLEEELNFQRQTKENAMANNSILKEKLSQFII